MSIMPGAVWRPITVPGGHVPRTPGRGVILHVAVSEATSLFSFFNNNATANSHFYVAKDGTIEQYIDTAYVAWTSVDANKNTIGVETQGGVTNVEGEPWTAAQVASLAKICAWAHATEGTPLQEMANSLPTTRGIGYHRLGINPWRIAGGELWSSTTGKVCPGDAKIAQVPQIIALATQSTATPPEDFLMALSDAQQVELYNTVRILGQQVGGPDWAAGNWGWPTWRTSANQESLTVIDFLREIDRQLNSAMDLAGRPGANSDNEFGQILSLRAEVHALAAKLDAVAAKVGA